MVRLWGGAEARLRDRERVQDPFIGRAIRWKLLIFLIKQNWTQTSRYDVLACVAPYRKIDDYHMSRLPNIWMFNAYIRCIKSANFDSVHPL